MAGTNILVWNPGQSNQENDAAYLADSLRSGGAGTDAIFPSVTANKVLNQVSAVASALCQAFASFGFDMDDSNVAAMVAAFETIITNLNLSFHFATKGHIKIGAFILQWAQGTLQSTSGSSQTIVWDIDFPTACLTVMAGTQCTSPADTQMSFFQLVSYTAHQAVVFMQRNADHGFQPSTPIVWGIGY